jgi:hypothetical protein
MLRDAPRAAANGVIQPSTGQVGDVAARAVARAVLDAAAYAAARAVDRAMPLREILAEIAQVAAAGPAIAGGDQMARPAHGRGPERELPALRLAVIRGALG